MAREPFWRTKSLAEMSRAEWESLCDGCARCCLIKLEDEEDGAVAFTDVACRMLDLDSCRCNHYGRRNQLVPDCVKLSPDNVANLEWMPATCAYRLVAEGRDLYWWHPLVSGSAETVHRAGISVRGRVVWESRVPDAELEDHVVAWPGEEAAD